MGFIPGWETKILHAECCGKEKKKSMGVRSNIYWFKSDSGGGVFNSSFLQSFTSGPGLDVSCELNKCILA